MKHFAEIAWQGRAALLARDYSRLAQLMDENFNTRRKIYNLPPWQVQMSRRRAACRRERENSPGRRRVVGTYRDDAMFEEVRAQMARSAAARSNRRWWGNAIRSRGEAFA